MTTVIGSLIVWALTFYAFETFWLKAMDHTKNDDIYNDASKNMPHE